MVNQRKHRLLSIISTLLSVVMILANCPLAVFAAETITQGEWTIVNEESSGTATFGDIGFTYHSPTTTITNGKNGVKDYVRSNNTNGSASNGIVVTNNKSYCDFTPAKEGTLTVYVGNASTKTGYVSRTSTAGASEAIGSFIPGGSGEYDSTGFKVTQGTTWATIDIEVEPEYTYYITLSGSKMFCYGAEFVPYTPVSGTITDSFNLGSYNIKFTNKTTNEVKNATVTGNSYSISLKPGYEYSAALSGSDAVSYGFSSDTRLITVEQLDEQIANLTIEESVSYKVSGSIIGLAQGYQSSDLQLVFKPEDTTSYEDVRATLDTTALTYEAMLVANEKYTLELVGAYDYKLESAVTVNNATSSGVVRDINLVAVPTYSVTGGFLGLTQVRGEYNTLAVNPTAITFENVADKYQYTGTIANGAYSVSLRDGSYLASIVSEDYSTSTHVVVEGGNVTRDLLLKELNPTAIAYTDTVYVGSDKDYKSVQAAVDAIARMTRTEGQRVKVMIDPGTYREQVVVATPNVTFESNGGTSADTTITWYYGIGYKYYSCVNNYYDPYADYDKFEKGDVVKYWGATVITTKDATGFNAKNIKFENSFNKYMTDEEIADGVEVNGLESITVVRKENTNVDSRAATERAAAHVNYADKVEYTDCAFIGSQDTLYTSNFASDAYYKSCYIEGQTDYIFGDGNVIFDGCELNFCGYDGTEASGYITANSCADAANTADGYVFRNCYVSYNSQRDVTAGTWGRMWGKGAKVSFINTQLQEPDMITGAGWTAMSVDPTATTVTLKEYNTTHNGVKVDTSSRVNGVVDTINKEDFSVESIFINKGWTPNYYTGDVDTTPVFETNPTMTSNGDLNTPNPGETITLGYALGSDWADEDASRISWYAVDTTYDGTSLATILESATLLKTTSAVSTNKFQIPMECAGKYIMAVVTPITINGNEGEAKYVIDVEKAVSNTWSDPDNEGSIAPGSGINVYLAGDSTVKDYSAAGIYNGGKTLDQGSWGEFLQYFFDENFVTVNNYAQGGRSSRSFINEGKLDTIAGQLKEGDYLLIQFGHNDCANGASYYEERFAPLFTESNPATAEGYPTIVPTEAMKVATPTALQNSYGDKYYSWDCGATYKGYIQQYINIALEKGAIPVIVSPVARLYYNADGTIKAHHDANMSDYAPTIAYQTSGDAYVTACEELYNENKTNGTLYIDGFNITKDLYEEAYTAGGSATNGEAIMSTGDKTHSNKTGGVIEAALLAKNIQDAGLTISQYVKQPTEAYGENADGNFIFKIKNSVFEACDNQYVKSDYWSAYGQALLDSLSGAIQDVNLNFATDEALALYETNATDTYTEGVFTGVYKNSEGVKFDTSIYQSGIQYYNNQSNYGTKASINKPIFSFVAKNAANYTIKVSTSTGSGTVGLFTDASCTTSVATAQAPGELVYKKTTATPETLYFATPEAGNMYISNVEISYVVPQSVTLNFASEAALALYETNAETSYTNGQITGTYTNTAGDMFDTIVYQSGIQYYNNQSNYGTKATVNIPIFSFVVTDPAMYTITTSASTGTGTVGLFTDKECTTPVVSGAAPGNIVYKKKTAGSETLYYAASVSNNMYVSDVAIETATLPAEQRVDYNGEISGIESDDTNVQITLKGSTETLNISAEDYIANGISLILGETYDVTAKGDKGVYLGTSIVTDDTGVANLMFSRIMFDFKLDFVDYYDDYKAYLVAMGYGNYDITDPYSDITIHGAGIVQSDGYKSYGVKTNSNKIISFKAKQSGVCTVTMNISVSNADNLILKINDVYAPVLTSAVQGSEVKLSTIVKKDDVVTIYTPTRSNLWYKDIDVEYVQAAFTTVESVVNTADNELMLYGAVPQEFVGNIESVGFYYTSAPVSGFENSVVADESSTVHAGINYNGNNYSVDGSYVFGTILTDIANVSNVYVYTFCKTTDGNIYYSAPVEVTLN